MTSGPAGPAERRLREVATGWDLRVDGAFADGGRPALPVRTAEGQAALLEHAPDGSMHEHLALRAWDARGAVRLLRADPRRHLLLTERTEPAVDAARQDPYEACTGVGALYAVLHRDPIPQPPRLVDLAAAWVADLDRPGVAATVPRRFVEQVRAWTPGLVDPREARPVLLHGDLRPLTVRTAADGRRVAVAPRPLVGDPAYEVASVLGRWEGATESQDLRGDLLERFYAVVDAAGLDEDRARAWVVVRGMVNVLWAVEDADRGLPLDAAGLTRQTTMIKAMIP